jgi:hypothetical protein
LLASKDKFIDQIQLKHKEEILFMTKINEKEKSSINSFLVNKEQNSN